MPEYSSTPYSDEYLGKVHRRLFETHDGKLVAMGRNFLVVEAGTAAINVRVPDLAEIEAVLNVQIHTDPATDWECIGNKEVIGNLVGLTIYDVVAGTTLTAEVIASGVPT